MRSPLYIYVEKRDEKDKEKERERERERKFVHLIFHSFVLHLFILCYFSI